MLGTLFLGAPEYFPCGNGSVADAANVQLLDWNGDGAIRLSDALASATYLFVGGPGHALGSIRECVTIESCPDLCRD